MARKYLSDSDLRKYKNDAVRAYIAATDLECALRTLDIANNDHDLKLLVMSLRDLSEVLQNRLKNYIEQIKV